MRLGSTVLVVDPALGQIQTIGDGQARMMIGDRQRHRDLTVVGLAEPPAILARHADRVRVLLLKSCVVDNPGFDASLGFERGPHELMNFR